MSHGLYLIESGKDKSMDPEWFEQLPRWVPQLIFPAKLHTVTFSQDIKAKILAILTNFDCMRMIFRSPLHRGSWTYLAFLSVMKIVGKGVRALCKVTQGGMTLTLFSAFCQQAEPWLCWTPLTNYRCVDVHVYECAHQAKTNPLV